MSDYSVRVANPFDSLLSQPGTSVGKRRSKKKKKSDTLSSSEPSTQQAVRLFALVPLLIFVLSVLNPVTLLCFILFL